MYIRSVEAADFCASKSNICMLGSFNSSKRLFFTNRGIRSLAKRSILSLATARASCVYSQITSFIFSSIISRARFSSIPLLMYCTCLNLLRIIPSFLSLLFQVSSCPHICVSLELPPAICFCVKENIISSDFSL